MNSLDPNILLDAANVGAPEHAKALAVVDDMIANPSEWILADQVLWEDYKALRYPKILQKPRTAMQAAEQLLFSGSKVVSHAVPMRSHFSTT